MTSCRCGVSLRGKRLIEKTAPYEKGHADATPSAVMFPQRAGSEAAAKYTWARKPGQVQCALMVRQ